MSLTRTGRPVVLMFAVVGALLLGLAAPASAGTGPGSATRLAETDAAYEQLGLADLETDLSVIALRCRGHVETGEPIAECAWRTDVSVASFQLWRLDLRVDDAARVLVAEVGADATTARDPSVTAPGAYLYAVLGLDADGEIVARSRPDRVGFRAPSVEQLRLECDAVRDGLNDDDPEVDAAPTIGCTWSAAVESDVRAYRLYRATHGGERELIATVGADVTRVLDTDVEAGVRYLYRVEGVDAGGATVAHSRLDGAGWVTSDRGGREERREVRTDDRDVRDSTADQPVDEPDAEDTVVAAADAADDPAVDERDAGDQTGDRDSEERTSDAGRRDAEARPAADHDDRRGQGR